MNKIQTSDGYTKVRNHDFEAMESELAALRAERDELREALDIIANEDYQHIGQLKAIARAVLAKYTKGDTE